MSILAAVLSVTLIAGMLVGCGKKDVSSDPPRAVTYFLQYVQRIKTPITADSQADIEGGYIIYEHLKDEYKTRDDVAAGKQVLDGYNTTYAAARAERDAEELAQEQATARNKFIWAVSEIPDYDDLAETDTVAVNKAYSLYSALNSESRSVSAVVVAYQTLTDAEARIAEIVEEARIDALIALVNAFIEDVNELKEKIDGQDDGVDIVENKRAIEDIVFALEGLTEEARTLPEVADDFDDAKATFDGIYADYIAKKDDADAETFSELADGLVLADIKLNSDDTIALEAELIEAETLYGNMTDEAKEKTGVAEAYEKVQAARGKYDEVFAAREETRIQAFIDAAAKITVDASDIDITWYDTLQDVSNAYYLLATSTRADPRVQDSIAKWDAAQSAFDRKGYQKLPDSGITLEFSGDAPPHLLFGSPDAAQAMLKTYRDFYGVSTNEELDNEVDLMIKVYIDFKYVSEFRIHTTAFQSPGHIVFGSVIREGLMGLTATDSRIVSGANYSFSCYFADKGNDYIHSGESKLTSAWNTPVARNTYTW